ncbi:MAG: hypothetical protein JSU94_05830 [Phycisphaerales bacterium]|nr:MAG: hypothetical protein JSU94_05830 [Phycisphaerales bacterium]
MGTKKTTAILAGCLLAAAGLFLLLDSGQDKDTPISATIDSPTTSRVASPPDNSHQTRDARPTKPTTPADLPLNKEQFEKLSPHDQNKVMEEFVAGFWLRELGETEEAAAEQKYLSLDVFSRPYMHTIKESEFAQLSPEDREKALSEVVAACTEYRAHAFAVIAQARVAVGSGDYPRAEALLIAGLERGRGLSADKEGLLITRLVGMGYQKACLRQMQQLYAKTGDRSRAGMVQGHLQGLEAEMQVIRAEWLRQLDLGDNQRSSVRSE